MEQPIREQIQKLKRYAHQDPEYARLPQAKEDL